MGFFKKKEKSLDSREQIEAPVSDTLEQLSTDAMTSFAKLLQANGIEYTVEGNDNTLCYRGYGSYLRIETTQLFTNAGCAMTYLNKQWRANPFAVGDLGTIDVDIANPYVITTSTLLPAGQILDETIREQTIRQIKTLIAQEEGFFSHIQCDDFVGTPYITISIGYDDPIMQTADKTFGSLQLFALAVHRIFGSITVPTGESAPPPKSEVRYTPDATDANGGYFVYSLNGDPWWIIDADFKFQSVVGAGVWKEFKDAEAGGLPLTATDMNNIYHYDDGVVYDPNGNAVGRYYAERYDLK
jgi:hypothetical protein